MSAISTALFLTNPSGDAVFQKMSASSTSTPSQSQSSSRHHSTNNSRKTSIESAHSATSSSSEKQNALHKLGQKIAKAAREHHRSVNSAFTAYYGLPVQQGARKI